MQVTDATFKSSVDKFYDQEALNRWAETMGAEAGDLMLLMAGEIDTVRKQLCELRLHMGDLLNLKDLENFKALWVVDFPLVEWDEDNQIPCHAPSVYIGQSRRPSSNGLGSGAIRANAYDMVSTDLKSVEDLSEYMTVPSRRRCSRS